MQRTVYQTTFLEVIQLHRLQRAQVVQMRNELDPLVLNMKSVHSRTLCIFQRRSSDVLKCLLPKVLPWYETIHPTFSMAALLLNITEVFLGYKIVRYCRTVVISFSPSSNELSQANKPQVLKKVEIAKAQPTLQPIQSKVDRWPLQQKLH